MLGTVGLGVTRIPHKNSDSDKVTKLNLKNFQGIQGLSARGQEMSPLLGEDEGHQGRVKGQ